LLSFVIFCFVIFSFVFLLLFFIFFSSFLHPFSFILFHFIFFYSFILLSFTFTFSDCNNNNFFAGGGPWFPLYIAVEYNQKEILPLLLATKKCDLNMKGYHGTALDLAIKLGHTHFVEILQQSSNNNKEFCCNILFV
jgi:Ankyrin repeats (3 copies)